MAATRASKLVECTNYETGVTFYVSANKIIKFTTVLGVADTLLTYINQADTQVTVRITQAVATIATAMESSTISLAIALTVEKMNGMTLPSSVIYINKERIVYLDTNPTTGANTDVTIDTGKADYEVWTISSPAIASVAAENMIAVTMERNDLVRYINNLYIDQVVADATDSSNLSSTTVSAAGTGYVPGNTITLAGGTYTAPAVLSVTNTKVITAAVVAGGTGGTPGAVTITGTTGTGTPFQATGTINGSGILTGALVVTVPGNYTVNPTSIAVEPVTGGSLSGCTVILTIGVLTTSVSNAGQYSVVPSNPIAQLATSGSGTGATFTGTFGDGAQILYDNRRTGFVKLQVAESAAAIQTAVNAL